MGTMQPPKEEMKKKMEREKKDWQVLAVATGGILSHSDSLSLYSTRVQETGGHLHLSS